MRVIGNTQWFGTPALRTAQSTTTSAVIDLPYRLGVIDVASTGGIMIESSADPFTNPYNILLQGRCVDMIGWMGVAFPYTGVGREQSGSTYLEWITVSGAGVHLMPQMRLSITSQPGTNSFRFYLLIP